MPVLVVHDLLDAPIQTLVAPINPQQFLDNLLISHRAPCRHGENNLASRSGANRRPSIAPCADAAGGQRAGLSFQRVVYMISAQIE